MRVERDTEIQRLADEKERLERVRRQDTEDQTLDSLPSDNDDMTSNPFKPINTLVVSRVAICLVVTCLHNTDKNKPS